MELKNKVVAITGASKGLGREIVTLLAAENCKLALIARSEKDLSELTSELRKTGTNCEYFICDVTDDKQVSETIQKVLEKFGQIDVLINDAGLWIEGKIEENDPKKVKSVFDVVALGTIYTTIATIPQMKKQKQGIIFIVVSIAGVGTPGDAGPYSAYTAAKHAITGFTKAIEEELTGTGIKVMGFYPGGMNTGIFKTAGYDYSDNEDWMMDKKDIAKIAVFMLKQPEDVIIDHLVDRKFKK
jgi:short-subunit dehydrogenase